MVGLEGDFKILTCWEGTHGWAVTKYTSFATGIVTISSSSSSQFVTLNVIVGVYVLNAWGEVKSENGVAISSVGVVWTESRGSDKMSDLSSTLIVGGGDL
jgi:hypothetical protein